MPERKNIQNLTAAQMRQLKNLQAEHESLKREMAKADQRSKELEQKRQSAEEETAKARQDLTSAETELTRTRKELEKERNALVAAGNELAAFQKEMTAVKKELSLARKELEKVGKREQAEQLKFLAQRTELEERLASAGREIEELRGKIAGEETSWLKEKKELTKSLDTLKREKEGLAIRLQEELRARENLAAALNALGKAVPDLADQPVESKEFGKALKQYLASCQRLEKRVAELEAILEDDQSKLAEAEGLDSRIGDLISLNRSLQEELDSARENQELLESRIQDLRAEAADQVRGELEAARQEMGRLQLRISTLTKENSSLMLQMQQENKIAVLSPERVSIMLNDFQESLQSGMKDVQIRDGEVRLKVGIAAVDEQNAGFIIPSAGNIDNLKEGLSEISFRFGKGLQTVITPKDTR